MQKKLKITFISFSLILLFFTVGFLTAQVKPESVLDQAAVVKQEKELKINYLLKKANDNFFSKNYQKSANQYLEVISILSNDFPDTLKNRKRISNIRNSLSLVYTSWAEKLLIESRKASGNGNIDKAINLANEAKKINPELKKKVKAIVKKLKRQKEDNKFNKITSDKDLSKFDQKKHYNMSVMFEQGKLLLQKNKLDKAKDKFEQILVFDPYNSKAMHYLNIINKKLYEDGQERREGVSAKRVSEVSWASAMPVTSDKITGQRIDFTSGMQEKIKKEKGSITLDEKLEEITIPHISFNKVPVYDALIFLKNESKRLDPSGKGVNIVLDFPPKINPHRYNVTLIENRVPLITAIKHVCEDAGVSYNIKKYGVFVSPKGTADKKLVTKVFPAEKEKFGSVLLDAESTPSTAVDLIEYFKARNVEFPKGASAVFDMRISRIIVRNTPEQISKIKEILEKLEKTVTPQVSIAAKFIEISQTDFEELGFQWNVNASSSNLSFPAVGATTRNAYDDAIGERTSGYPDRMFKFNVSHKNIDISATIHALAQSSKTEQLSSPRVTTLNGYTTVIKVVTERYFPQEWNDPKIMETTANDNKTSWLIKAYPTFGDTTEIGVVFKVTPFICSDNYTIDLILEPTITRFVEYNKSYNYTALLEANQGTKEVEFKNEMPVIASRSIKTRLRVYDGDTVVMGGALTDETTKYNDKVPMIGDIPLVGRLFQSEIEDVEKKNLLIFTTVHLVMPDGTLLRPENENGLAKFPDTF
ncbi:MAG: hypothetical protein K9L78_00120 [Victivallales bacterium]|nr:hypothetical protein [Victivallales bacterium]MCF7888501.1 hypothetical protein [Victivallales bacterium]